MAPRAIIFAVAAAATAPAALAQYCGNATAPNPRAKANVLIIGDSISMAVPYTPGGYGVNVQSLLEPKGITVNHAGGWFAGGQCSNTPKGLNCTDASTAGGWLDFAGEYDLIHFNFGLHDLVNCTNNPECSEHVDISVYGANLVTIAQRLAPRTKLLMFATTTPSPNCTAPACTGLGRTYENVVRYNAEAISSLKGALGGSVLLDDLWGAVIAHCGAGYASCDWQIPQNVHFEPAGQAGLGAHVAASILEALGM